MVLEWLVSSYTAVAEAIMVLFSSRNIMRREMEELCEKAKKERASMERKWEEQLKACKEEISLSRKVEELTETCKLILEEQKKKYILISDALTEIKSMASRTGLDPQEIKEMCGNLESKQDEILEILGRN